MTICFAEVLVLVSLISCLSSQGSVGETRNEICKIEKNFHSSAMTALAEEMAEVNGCSVKLSSFESKEIYVLSLRSSGFLQQRKARTGYIPSVSLHIRPHWKQRVLATNTVIILHSVTPVMWQVHLGHVKSSTNFNIIVNKPSYIVPSFSVPVSREKIPLKKKLSSWILSHYGAITSFSSISMANKITLFIGSDNYASGDCNINSTARSENVEATFAQPQPASGCNVHNNNTERRFWHLYVVELNFTKSSQNVLIHLQSHIESDKTQKHILEQNLILVLKCHVPTMWVVESTELQGSLLILAESPVRMRTNPKHITVMVQNKGLPSDTTSLLHEVQNSFGSVDSYIIASNANRINVNIKEKYMNFNQEHSVEETSKSASKTLHRSSSESDLLYSIVGNNLKVQQSFPNAFWKQSLSQLLAKQMTVECSEHQIKVVFSLSKTVDIFTKVIGMDYKLSSVSLTDIKCKAHINESHIVLQSEYEECGTQSYYDEDKLIYQNQVQFSTVKFSKGSDSIKRHFTSDDDDSSDDGSGSDELFIQETSSSSEQIIYPIPFYCTNRPYTIASTFIKRYGMNIFSSRDFQNPILRESYPFKVAPNDHIFVEATISADARLCIIADECWLTERKNLELKTNKENILIKQGCATDLNVKILSNSSCRKQASDTVPHALRFSFQLSDKFMNKNVYLKCYISFCASKDNTQMGVKQCIDAENFCLDQSLRPYLNLHDGKKELLIRGPFFVSKSRVDNVKVESSSPENFVDYSFDKLTGTHKKNSLSPQLIFIGLSTEAVVGIAFASFIIGAGLMAALWLIHMHTEPSRRSKKYSKSTSKQEHLSYHCSSQLKYEDTTENAENFVPHSARPMSLPIGS